MKYDFFERTNEVLIKVLDTIKTSDNRHEISRLAGHIASVYSARDEAEAYRLASVAVMEVLDYQAKFWNKSGFETAIEFYAKKLVKEHTTDAK